MPIFLIACSGEVPEAGKKSVLLSTEAPCVPARNMRQFLELLLERGDKETASAILNNYVNCLDAKDIEPRRKVATGIGQLADLFALSGSELSQPRFRVWEMFSPRNKTRKCKAC